MKQTVLVSILTVIGCLVPISIIAQEVGKQGDTPEPPRIESLTVDEMRGDWKAEKIGDKESPEDDIVIKFKDEKSQKLVVEGKYKDWEADGAVADGRIAFTRKPKAVEMSDKAPEWARDKIAAEGKLKWKLELKAESRKGEWVLEGKWYPGQFKWKEAENGSGGAQEASYLDEGKPVEVKFKREPAIIDVVVLNNQTGFANGNPLHGYPFLFRPPPGARGFQGAPRNTLAPPYQQSDNRRTLFIYGPNLPKDYAKKIELHSSDPTIRYSVRAFSTDQGLSADDNRLFKVGWDEAVKGLDEDTRKTVKKTAAMLVRVDVGQGVVPGLKNFALNKMEASWRLRFGDDRAWIRFVRDVTANETEVINSAYLPERIYIEVRTETPFPIKELPLRAGVNGQPIKWNGADTIVASYVNDEPTGDAYEVFHDDRPHEYISKMVRVYRTPVIVISGEAAASGGNGYQLSLKAGDVCYAKLDDPYLLTATPPHGRVAIWDNPERDESGNVVLTWESALENAATLDGHSVRAGGNLRSKEAPAISNIVFTNIVLGHTGSAKRSLDETTSHWTSIFPTVFAWRYFFGDRGVMTESVPMTVGDHAALLLFKDTFARKMKEELDTLERITKGKSNPDAQKAALRGFRDAIKPYAWDESSPWRSLTVAGPGGDARLSLALDDGYLASTFKGDPKAADEWSLKAVGEGLEKYKEAIRFALQKAKDCPDQDIKQLMELIGYGYEALLPDLLPKMMRLAPVGSTAAQMWQPDLNARFTLWNLHIASDAIRAQEDLAKLDTEVAIAAASMVTLPFMFGEGAICAIACWAFDGATLGIQLVSETIPELWEEYHRDEIKFALGASAVLGVDRLNEAELKQTQWFSTVLSVLPAAMGFSMSSVQAIPHMERAVAKARTATLVGQVEKHGADAFKRFTEVEKTAFLTAVSEAETLKEMGATHSLTKSHERAAAAGEKLAGEAGVKTTTLKNRTGTVEAIGNPAKAETAAVPERNYISPEEKSSKPATPKEEGAERTAKLDGKSVTLKADDARAPTKAMSRAARDLDELEGLNALRGDKNPELNPLQFETTMPDGVKQPFTLGKFRGKGAFNMVYDVIAGPFEGFVAKFVWEGDIFRTEEQIAKDMMSCGKRLRDAKIPHLKIREVPGCAGAKTPFVIQEKLPVGAKAFSEGTDRNLIKAFLSQNGRGKATVKLFWQLKEAGLVLEDARVVNLYWQEVNGEWICGILDVDRVIPFAERNTPLGKVIDWVEACVTGDTVKSLYAARRSSFASRADSALAFVNRMPNGRVGPYLPNAEIFMEKMFEHKGWIDCEFLDAAGNVTADASKIKSVRYKDGLISVDDIRELFKYFDDPARTKELDLTRPYHSSLLRIPAFIFRTAAVSTISTHDLGQSQSQFPMVSEFFTEDLLLAAA